MVVPRTFPDQGESAAGPARRGLPACSSATGTERIRCAESAESVDRNNILHGMNQASKPIMVLLPAATSHPSSQVRGFYKPCSLVTEGW